MASVPKDPILAAVESLLYIIGETWAKKTESAQECRVPKTAEAATNATKGAEKAAKVTQLRPRTGEPSMAVTASISTRTSDQPGLELSDVGSYQSMT